MKNKQLIGLALAVSAVFSTTSCNKDEFLDVNTSPNSPTAVGLPVLLTSSILTTGFTNANDLGRVSSLLVQHLAGIANQPATYDVYNIRGSFDNQWNGELYGGSLVNTKQLIDLATRQSSPAYSGIAKLLQAYNFAFTTDLYGDIPYSQALQGLGNLTPRFDKQEDIYKGNAALQIQSLFDLIKDGLADLDKPSALKPSISDDPVYAGDLAKWKRMGNTLLLKLANTISKKEPALAATIMNQAIAGAFASNSDDFEVPFGTSNNNQNPLYQYNFVTRPDDQMLSQTLLDSMAVRRDPRLPVFFNMTQPVKLTAPTANTTGTVTTVGTFTGYANGSNNAVPARIPVAANPALTNRSRYNVYIRGSQGEAPVRLLTNYQRLFILAEAAVTLPAVRLPAGATAQSLYLDAIRASMTKAGITDTAVLNPYFRNPRNSRLSTKPEVALNQIITQKWISLVGNGYEAYNDYRRTGYPRLPIPINAAGDDPTSVPKRIPYPNSELNANTNAEGLNKNIRTSEPVWWAR